MKGLFFNFGSFRPSNLRDFLPAALLGTYAASEFSRDNTSTSMNERDTEVPAGPSPQFRTEPEHERLRQEGEEYRFFNEALGLIDGRMQESFQSLVRDSFSSNVPLQNQGFINWSDIPGLGVDPNATGRYQQAITNVVDMALNAAQSDQERTAQSPHGDQLKKMLKSIKKIVGRRRAEQKKFAKNKNTNSYRRHAEVIEHWEKTKEQLAAGIK